MTPLPKFIRDWLQESLNRIFIKKPEYFKYWQLASVTLAGICGIPYLIQQFPQLAGSMPQFVDFLSNKVLTWVSVAMFWMSQLTVNTPTVGVTSEGSAVKVTDSQKLPFTAGKEVKEVEDAALTPPTISEVPESRDAPTLAEGGASGTVQ